MNAQEYANRLILLRVLRDKVDAADKALRSHWSEHLSAGDRKATRAGSVRTGYVLVTDPKGSWRVTDGDALRAWVRQHCPEEIRTVETINSAWEKAVLERGGVVDEATGEVVAPPGIAYVQGSPTVTVKPDSGAEAAIAAQYTAGGISWDDLRAVQ